MTTQDFLRHVSAIADEKPTYRLGGDGSDGTCDCIGLIIGACSRGGLHWKGIHGSNWAARHATEDMNRIAAVSDLIPGDLVYKVRLPGARRYDLPDRYAAHFDTKDYYHVGVVTQLKPLRIIHCTSPGGMTIDKRLGKWQYHGHLSLLDAPSVPDTFPPTIRCGSRGDVVTRLQLCLREQGYTLQPDGIFGPMTREAVLSYQSSRGLNPDGIVGPLTWRSLLTRKDS